MPSDDNQPDRFDAEGPATDSNGESQTQDLLRQLLTELVALREYAQHLVAATLDEAKARIRRAVLGVLWACAGCALATVLALAFLILFVLGIDGALGAAFGSAWAGHLVTGTLGLGLIGVCCWRAAVWTDLSRRDQKIDEYDLRKARQRAAAGRDVEEAAHEIA